MRFGLIVVQPQDPENMRHSWVKVNFRRNASLPPDLCQNQRAVSERVNATCLKIGLWHDGRVRYRHNICERTVGIGLVETFHGVG